MYIYTRIGDKNTPDNGNADMTDIENLWRKRLGLTKPPLEYIYDRLCNKAEWTTSDNGYYNAYRPEYTIEICPNDDDLDAEFYAYAMPNENTSYDELNIKYQTTILDSYQIVVLDGGRLRIPTPTWGFIDHYGYGLHHKCSYKYYICGSKRYKLLQFLYDPQNADHRYAFMYLQEVVVFYYSNEERLDFEAYIERHQNLLSSTIAEISQFDYIKTDTEQKTEIYKERLKVGKAINQLLKEWRNTHSST